MKTAPDADGTVTRRRYDSARRVQQAAQTRAAVLDAAVELFTQRGWTGTAMRDVARGAGVAVETVYTNFGSKVDLLQAALDVAVVGDDRAIALADRPEFAALGRGPLAQRAHAAARLVRDIHERTAGLGKALREGAAGDDALHTRLRDAEERRRTNVDQGARLVAGRPVTETERDGLWALLSMDVYELLVGHAAWTPDQYEAWIADAIVRLLRPARPARKEQ